MYLPTTITQTNDSHATPDASGSFSPQGRASAHPARNPDPRRRPPLRRQGAWLQSLARLELRVLGIVAPRTAAQRGVDLYCTPAPADTPALVTRDDGNPTLSMLKVDGNDLATYAWGDPALQPYVLLAHGWSSHSMQHLPWVEALRAAGYAVVAFDQQAHGRSSGGKATLPDFVCNLLAVGWRHGRAAAVIGHSLGGAAVALALKHGLEADRAILIAAQADPEEALGRFATAHGLTGDVHRRMVALLESNTGVAMEELQAHRNVRHLARPALVVHDIEDREVPWSDGERYVRHWPHSRLLTTCGLGHHGVAEDPTVIAASIRFIHGEQVGERIVSSPNLPFGLA